MIFKKFFLSLSFLFLLFNLTGCSAFVKNEANKDFNTSMVFADVKQIQTSLEVSHSISKKYPLFLEKGEKIGSSGFVMPSPPDYVDGGVCAIDFEYIYAIDRESDNYNIIYCIEKESQGIDAGYHICTNKGINQKKLNKEEIKEVLKDSDNDNICDYVEINIYKTDPNKKDSDNDGYNDLEEIKNGYNPTGGGNF